MNTLKCLCLAQLSFSKEELETLFARRDLKELRIAEHVLSHAIHRRYLEHGHRWIANDVKGAKKHWRFLPRLQPSIASCRRMGFSG
jgi:hypothetical protein